MKTVIIALTLFASVCTTSSYAGEGPVTPEVLKSFQEKFSAAKNAGWSLTQDLYKVQFSLNGQSVTAFYKADGTMAALTRHLSPLQLPVNLQALLKSDYSEFWISGLFELSNDEGVQYYATLENADITLVLKAETASWNVFQKSRKN